MVPKSFIVLGLVLAVIIFISSEVAAKDLETVKGIEDDRGFNGGGRGGNGGFNNGGGRGGNGGFNNGGGRGGNGGFNGGRGGNGGFNGGGRGGNNGGFNGRYCHYGVCCRRGYCQCCYSAAEATTEAKP